MPAPNILFIMTDQQSRHMMSCAGNPYVDTPAMDSLAASGTRFTRAYCTNPVCVPSRFSLFTGRMASEIELEGNGPVRTPEKLEGIRETGLGWMLRDAGYDAVYAGKQHLPGMDAEDLGFTLLTADERDELAQATADYVSRPHDKPWCLVASFINPHDICYMAIHDHAREEGKDHPKGSGVVAQREIDHAVDAAAGIDEAAFFETHCPPLPPNYDPQQDEPEALHELVAKRAFRRHVRENWGESEWRMHRWVYARLTERVDAQIGQLLDALRLGPAADNTVIIFTSDHGDHDSSHRMEHKTYPYEEAAGVPLIIGQPGQTNGAVTDATVVSNGLDLYPTICDYAGAAVPSHTSGLSLRPLVDGDATSFPREYVPIESDVGNAIVGERYKYVRCFSGARAEQLYDLNTDPHETCNSAQASAAADALEQHRQLFDAHFGEVGGV